MSAHRWLICLYFVKNSTRGGESVILDGFQVAEDFRQKHPHHFHRACKRYESTSKKGSCDSVFVLYQVLLRDSTERPQSSIDKSTQILGRRGSARETGCVERKSIT